MTDLTAIVAEITQLPEVYSAKIWDGRRVYVNIVGYDRAFAGDRNAKVYYDLKLGWQIDGLKGNRSSTFGHNLRSFADKYCPRAFSKA